MDLVNNLMQSNAPMKTFIVPGAEVDGAVDIVEADLGEMHEPEGFHVPGNYTYAWAYQDREAATYMEAAKRMASESSAVSNVRFVY